MTKHALAAWTVYRLAEATWWLESKFFGHLCIERAGGGRPWINLSIYPLYNRLMLWSEMIQGPSGNGPWGPEEPTEMVCPTCGGPPNTDCKGPK